MIYSMTGFGRGEASFESIDVTVEIKTVNNRYCEISMKMPKRLNAVEDRLKNSIKDACQRGRIDVYINIDEAAKENTIVTPNFEVLDQYVNAYESIRSKYSIEEPLSLALLTRVPDGISVDVEETDAEAYYKAVAPALEEALENLLKMRKIEGDKLVEDVLARIATIKGILVILKEKAPLIVSTHREKMMDRLNELMETTEYEVDESKVAMEVAVFSDKTNITEEIVRLDSHLDQIGNLFENGGALGRKLDFLIQEMNREVNTIGSKSPDVDISTYVIEMKAEIEKIREQIQNLE